MKVVLILLLLPCLLFGQDKKEDYAIYSQYLKEYQSKKKVKKINFVIREAPEYLKKRDTTAIRDIITELRNYLNGDVVAKANVKWQYQVFADTLSRDTLWMPLLAELDRKTKTDLVLKNMFTKPLHTSVISNAEYKTYFEQKEFKKRWPTFYAHYPKTARLVEFSAIACDGKRAVFYFTASFGALGGEGYIVFCFKERGKWKFIPTAPLWQS